MKVFPIKSLRKSRKGVENTLTRGSDKIDKQMVVDVNAMTITGGDDRFALIYF
jgi:hypothetical protein